MLLHYLTHRKKCCGNSHTQQFNILYLKNLPQLKCCDKGACWHFIILWPNILVVGLKGVHLNHHQFLRKMKEPAFYEHAILGILQHDEQCSVTKIIRHYVGKTSLPFLRCLQSQRFCLPLCSLQSDGQYNQQMYRREWTMRSLQLHQGSIQPTRTQLQPDTMHLGQTIWNY